MVVTFKIVNCDDDDGPDDGIVPLEYRRPVVHEVEG